MTMVSVGSRSSVWRRYRLRSLRWIVTACTVLGATGQGAAAFAVDPVEDELNRRGVEARKREDDAGALEYFKKAYELHHSPRGAAQMGLAEIALGRWSDAADHLEEALAAPSDPWIKKNEQVLRESLDRVLNQFGTLQILGTPSGAEVVVEGRVVGTVPMKKAARIRTGDCRFEVRAPGHASATRTVVIESSVPRRETVDLSQLSARSVVSTEPTATQRPGGPSPIPPPTSPAVEPDSGSNHGSLRTTGVILGAAGVLAIGTGVGFGIAARSAGTDNSKPGNTFDPDADRSGKRYQTLQYVGYGVGAALLTAGVVTFVLGIDPDRSKDKTSAAFVPLQGHGGALVLLGAF